MKQLLAAAALVAAAALGAGQPSQALADTASAAQPAKKYQLVFQVSENDPKQWNFALNMAFLFQKNIGRENSEIEIVAIGPGLNMLKSDSKASDRIAQAMDRSIDVVACGETMKAMHVAKADLIGGVRVVPGGLIEVVNRQRAGWSYIRP
jgi:intracellular sulfur oxidation DsrE/DsrF family protein